MGKHLGWLIGVAVCVIMSSSFSGFAEEELPIVLDRLEFITRLETDQKPYYYLQTICPLYYIAGEEVLFVQPRVSIGEDDILTNLGLVYRKLWWDDKLLGGNVFLDYAQEHSHGRLGLGIEVKGEVVDFNLNSYFRLTKSRLVKQGSNYRIYERVANGLDVELGIPVPYLPFIRFSIKGFWYDFNNFTDRGGWEASWKVNLGKGINVKLSVWDDNKGELEYKGELNCKVRFDRWQDILKSFYLSNEPITLRDVGDLLLEPVDREYIIALEKWMEIDVSSDDSSSSSSGGSDDEEQSALIIEIYRGLRPGPQ